MTWTDFLKQLWVTCQTAVAFVVVFAITFLLPAFLNEWVERTIG